MNHFDFILSTSGNYFNLQPQNEKFQNNTCIENFLSEESLCVLTVTLSESKNTLEFLNQIPNDGQNRLLFFKNNVDNELEDSSKKTNEKLGFLTLNGGIIRSIYNSISSTFMLDALTKNNYSPDVISLIEDLRSHLSVSLGVAETGIVSIRDEIYFWNQKSLQSPTKSDKEAAKVFSERLEHLNDAVIEFQSQKSYSKLKHLEDLIDKSQNILDELWRIQHYQYPQNRMISILNVLASLIVNSCVDELGQENIWQSNSMSLTNLFSHIFDILSNWLQLCDSLTRLFWTNCEYHHWIGKPHIPNLILKFRARLEEILDYKQVHKQITLLSAEDESIELKSKDFFYTFRDIQIFDTTPLGDKSWDKARANFEHSLCNIDDKIVMNIKLAVQSSLGNPRQIIHIFSKYENILKRPRIREMLKIECDHLHESILSFIKSLTDNLNENKNNKSIYTDDEYEVSQTVSEIELLKIIEYQVLQVDNIFHEILSGRDELPTLNRAIIEFKTDLDTQLKSNFNKWCENSSASVANGDLVLKDNEPVVKFEKRDRQLMTVTYKKALIKFCKDIQHLKSYGFTNIPNDLMKYSTNGKKYIKYAKNLQQISAFHNTIGDRIIPCLRPIMLKNAIELSNLVKSESVSWNDEESVVRYISILQQAVDRLANDNILLSGHHESMKKSILKLMNTDLLKHGKIWKEELKSLRNSFVELEKKGFSNLNLFKLHWDYQLYKALEYQLTIFLIDSKERLPDINIDLVFVQQKLQFRPTLVEIRFQYYSELRKFIETPLSFHGFSDNSNKIFKVMVERNRSRFKSLYDRADRNFNKLCEFRDLWRPWVALGCVNLESICSSHLSTWENWDKNFKSCKNFSQKIAKIQSSEQRIDCFVVNLSPIRSHIEYISRHLWESLAFSLRSSILDDISVLHDFTTSSLNVLQHIPNDESGILAASLKYENITSNLVKMTQLFENVIAKNTCLAGWCKESVGSLESLTNQWEKLLPMIENHHILLQGQLEIVKENLQLGISNLNDEAEVFLIKWEDTIKDLESNVDTNFAMFKDRKQQWINIKEKRENLIQDFEKCSASFSKSFDEKFLAIEQDVDKYGQQWEVFEEFIADHEAIESEEWPVYRRKPYIFTDFLNKWEKKLTDVTTVPSLRIKKIIENYRSVMPTLTMLHSDSLNDKHWASIFMTINTIPTSYHDIRLVDVLKHSAALTENSDEIKAIIRQAYSEQIVRQAITELEQWGVLATIKLFMHNVTKTSNIMLIKDFDEVLNKIGDNQCLLQAAKNSVMSDSYMDQVDLWETKLNTLSYIMNHLCQIQKKWIYLEPIFCNGTLKNDDLSSFGRIDKDFRYIMKEVSTNSKVVLLTKINNITIIIESLLNQLQHCQNTLATYMTSKRDLFPRFYFLSDDDLLEILGQSNKDNVIQKHIQKLFPGVHQLGLSTENEITIIKCIKSTENDEIKLLKEVSTNESVEKWLAVLELEIKSTLKYKIKECFHSMNNDLTIEIIERYPMQVLCLINSVCFTSRLEKTISSMTLQNTLDIVKNDIRKFAKLLQSNLKSLTELKIRSMLFDFVYQVTTIEYLIRHNVTNLNDWHWLQQIKYYFNSKTELITVRVVQAEFEYSYEYLGNYNKLVYTSLTHNCYLTLSMAMFLGLGANPFGPAGTGKTECVKSFGAMLGRTVFVFNCNENIDTSAMALILTGLGKCGFWGCFDEFNRLQEETLSAIAMLIQPLQAALKDKCDVVSLLNKNISLNRHCCIFVTLNPADEEYGGRNQLPKNLERLFRPIVMQMPEPKEIAKVLLFIEGFKYAEEIGERIVELFDLSMKILSPQRHYDWGLRELKTVLGACGKVLSLTINKELSIQDEMELVVQAIKPNIMSKLTKNDCIRFNMLLGEVFANLNVVPSNQIDEFRNKIQESFNNLGLFSNPNQIDKCVQLYEQLTKRIGVAIIGPANSGKSTVLAVLKNALSSMSKPIRIYIISPKSMSRSQLLGYLDIITRNWHDGVLTNTAIAVNSEPSNVTSWIVCDGEVDPEWIEALNSVLDDNRLLTLPSGWRIQFGSNVNFIFETHNLLNASPATISRMGIINLSAEDLPAESIIESYAKQHTNSEEIKLMLEKYFEEIFDEFARHSKIVELITKLGVIRNTLLTLNNVESKEEFIVLMIKSLNGLIESTQDRNKFSNIILDRYNIYVSNPLQAENLFYNKFRSSVELYTTDENDESNYFDNYKASLLKTATMKSYGDLLRSYLKHTESPPFLIVGKSGSGKSLLVDSAVAEFSGYQLVTINCSAQLNTDQILYTIEQNCLVVSGIKGKEFKPKQTRLVLFMKNLDLCPVDFWKTSEVIELLLQIINRKGFYSKTLEWISIVGIQICGTLSNIRNQNISSRFLSKCNLLMTSYPNKYDMQKIVIHILNYIYNILPKNQVPMKKEKMADVIIDIYEAINESFSSDQSNHYNFTPKMIEQWIVGLSYYQDDKFSIGFFYELSRIFGDRLMSTQHVFQFYEIIQKNLQNFNLIYNDQETFFIQTSAKASKLEFIEMNQWKDLIIRNLPVCNSETAIIDLPLTPELIKVVSSMIRALCRPKSNVCVCGKLKAGRFESTALACTILNIKIFYLQVTKDYNLNDFYNDLKLVMQTCAMENEVAILYITDTWINYLNDILKWCEAILEGNLINNNMFGDDLETIASGLKNAAQVEGYTDSLISFFINRIKNNLHLVISLENSSANFQEILKSYPMLYAKTTFIWMPEFSTHTRLNLCNDVIQTIQKDQTNKTDLETISTNYYEKVIDHCGIWNDSPKRSIQLIKSYYYTYLNSENKISKHRTKLELGIQKLYEAAKYVENMKIDAEEKEKALAEKRLMANEALEMISVTMKNASNQKNDLLDLKTKTEENSEILKHRKLEIESELSLVAPLLKEASAAVGQIKSEALSEIRSLRAPPDAVRDILEGVLRLMGIRDTSWNSMKSFLAKRGVKEDIRSLNPELISPEHCAEVERLIETKSESFNYNNAKRASQAAAPLSSWVLACVKYSKVIQSIKPLEREQTQLEKNLKKSEDQMISLSSGIEDVNTRVNQLSQQLNIYTQEAAVLEIKLDDTRNILKSTEILVEKLSSEYKNWSAELTKINSEMKNLDKRAMLISICITHLSHMFQAEKLNYIKEICEILNTTFVFDEMMYTSQDSLVWESMGLTPDKQSLENACMLIKFFELPFASAPVPLLLDSTGTAYNWLTKYLTSTNRSYESLQSNDDRFTYNLELAVRFGKILIVTDGHQNYLPSLLSVISMRVYSRFNKKMLHIGNKFIDLHDEFKLLLISNSDMKNLSNFAIGNADITIIPFTLTESGLTDQLLSKWISLKHPEMESKRIELLQNEGKLMSEKIELQDKLLLELSLAEGDILKNDKLLATLNSIKESSQMIELSLTESFKIRQKLMENYNQYKEVCSAASTFYIGISKIYDINTNSFTKIFLDVLGLSNLQEWSYQYAEIVRRSYVLLSCSLKRSEHVHLGLNLCKYAYQNQIPDAEWEMFIFNFIDSENLSDNEVPRWIRKELVPKVATLKSQQPNFYNKLSLENENVWKNFVENRSDKVFLPDIQMSDFQKILIHQIFRPDFLLTIINATVQKLLGLGKNGAVQFFVRQTLNDATNDEPILITTTSGIDPTNQIKECAEISVGIQKYKEVFVGKGQEMSILESIEKMAVNGDWLCIKNIHLMPLIFVKIEGKLKMIQKNKNFKLIYICDDDSNIPANFTFKCRKILIEPPKGIKFKICNLLEQHQLMFKSKKDYRNIKLYIALFILHSILLERRNFVPQGFCKWYDFVDADLKAAIDFIDATSKKTNAANVDWTIVKGLIEKICYAGRIDNVQDYELLIVLIKEYFDNKIMNSKWIPKSINVTLNNSNNFEDYQNTFMKMDNDDSNPETFGIPSSSTISRNMLFCRNLLKDLRKTYFNIDDSENYEKRIRPLVNLWKKLSGSLNANSLSQISENSIAEVNPWKLFKLSEISVAINIYNSINAVLSMLMTVIQEIHSIDATQKNLLQLLSDNQVPYVWRKIWSQGPKVASDFLKEVSARIRETEKYLHKMDDPILVINFANIFHIDSFLSTVKLVSSRDLQQSTTSLALETFTEESRFNDLKRQYSTIISIEPLLIDGLGFTNGKLTTSDSAVVKNITSKIYLFYLANGPKELSKDKKIEIKLYSTPLREKFICNIKLSSALQEEEIILSGTCLLPTTN